jgi:hypothetical protein
MPQFDVVGEVEGEIEGDLDGEELAGYDVMGDEVVGVVRRNPRTGRTRVMKVSPKPRTMALAPKPSWRKEQMAPGVIRPDEGLVPLPLIPNIQGGTFTGAAGTATQITWQGQLQKPFRGERLLCSVVRSTTTATARLLGNLYVGTDLQQAEIAGWDIELIGNPTSFGTRLTCQPAEPGVLIRLVVNLSAGFTVTTDSIYANIIILGRIIH